MKRKRITGLNLADKNAFTMVELIFVIVIIGILSAIALPKFSETADLAYKSKAKDTVAIIQSAIATGRQKLILRGKANQNITSLEDGSGQLFNGINGDTDDAVLSSSVTPCANSNSKYCWTKNGTTYTYHSGDAAVDFVLNGNKFTCTINTTDSGKLCKYLVK